MGNATAQILGHAAKDSELKTIPGGAMVANNTIAVSDGSKEKPHTTWMYVEAYAKSAEILGEVRKGDPVYATGVLRTDEWETKEGQKRVKTVMRVDRIYRLHRRPAAEG